LQYCYNLSALLHSALEKFCCYLLILLALSEISIVLLRYIYGVGYLKLQDLALYSFSALVILSVVYSFGCNVHVRVDIFREKHSHKTKRIIDILAIIFCLYPLFTITLYWVWPDIVYAWSIYEGSRETGGLAGLFLVKSLLPVVCVLMIVQGSVVIIRGGRYLLDADDAGEGARL